MWNIQGIRTDFIPAAPAALDISRYISIYPGSAGYMDGWQKWSVNRSWHQPQLVLITSKQLRVDKTNFDKRWLRNLWSPKAPKQMPFQSTSFQTVKTSLITIALLIDFDTPLTTERLIYKAVPCLSHFPESWFLIFSNVEQKSMNRRFDHDRRVFKFAPVASMLRYFLWF